MFFKIARRKFCSGTQWHHDFHPPEYSTAPFAESRIKFDMMRIFIYLLIGLKITLHSASFILFRKTNFLNNPDYRLADKETFEKMKGI